MNTNPIDEYAHQGKVPTEVVSYDCPELATVDRLRYVSDVGFPVWDLSYAHGHLKDGTFVRVQVPNGAYQLPKKGPASALIAVWPELPKLVPGGYVRDVLSLCQ